MAVSKNPVEVVSDIHFNIPVDITFTDFLLYRAQQFGDRLALVDGDTHRNYTYSELSCNVIRCAAALYDLGVRQGDRICILLTNCVEYPIAVLAILRIGAICVPTNYMYTKHELQDLVTDCQPVVYITRSELVDNVLHATALLSNKPVIITIDDMSKTGDSIPQVVPFSSLLQSVHDKNHRQESHLVDNRHMVALICYSSGTTGKPKGCMQTHHAMIANACMNNATFCSSHFRSLSTGDVSISSPADEVVIAILPLFHIYAIEMYVMHALTIGLELVTLPRYHRENFLSIVQQHKVTQMHVVPTLLSDLITSTDENHLRRAMSSIRLVISAAVCLSDSVAQKFTELIPNAKICQLYGMSEIMASHGASPEVYKGGSIGRVMANVKAKVVDVETRRAVGPNIDGEILIKSPCVLKGYWHNDLATENAFDADGWFKTGDIGCYDEQGNFFIKDRIKDMMKYKGHSVAPAEIETVLLLHPDVKDAAVVAVKDDVAGDLPRAYIVTKTPTISTNDVIKFVNERVAPHKRIRAGIMIVDNIPRGPSGKILRRLLIENSSKQKTFSKL